MLKEITTTKQQVPQVTMDFPQPVDLAREYKMQIGEFHKWLMGSSTTNEFIREQILILC